MYESIFSYPPVMTFTVFSKENSPQVVTFFATEVIRLIPYKSLKVSKGSNNDIIDYDLGHDLQGHFKVNLIFLMVCLIFHYRFRLYDQKETLFGLVIFAVFLIFGNTLLIKVGISMF